jgi:hypothetical protein
MNRLRTWWQSLSEAARLRLVIVPVLLGGALVSSLWAVSRSGDWVGLALNLGTELGGAVVTFILLDLIIGGKERREAEARKARHEEQQRQLKTEREKEYLIQQLGSGINEVATRAAEELRVRGWLHDGSLQRARLNEANLRRADLRGADLRGAGLFRANLEGARLFKADLRGVHLVGANLQGAYLGQADLQGAHLAGANLHGVHQLSSRQLAQVNRLKGATMPDGSRYDGRFILVGDIKQAAKNDVDPDDPAAMAEWYCVPTEVYWAGQAWAHKNLAKRQVEDRREDDH